MDGSEPVEAHGIRITSIVVNREPRPFNDLAGFSDYGMTGTLDVGVRTPMLRCTLRAGRMARSRRAVEAVNAAGEPSRLLSAPRSPARAGFAGGGARMAASYAGGVVSHIIRRRIFQIISGGRCADFPHYFGFTGSRHGLRRRISRPPDEGAGGSFRQARWDVALRSAGTGTGSGYAVVGARSARVRRRIRAGYPTPGRAAAVPRRRGVAGSRAGNSA